MKKYRSEKKTASKPVGKTLTVLNVPPYATEESLKRVFSVVGLVESVQLIDNYKNEHKSKYNITTKFFDDRRPFTFQIGFVVFKKSESLDLVLRINELPALSTEENPVLTGISKWTAEYNSRVIDTDEMRKEIDLYMNHYDKVKKAEDDQGNDEVDDDGWVTVGKKGHNSGFKQKESVISRLEQKIQNRNKRAKQMSNFYTFEMRENKRNQLMELRKNFENDKMKMQQMKSTRKFKPY